jgi:hypothetical protein
MRIAWWVVCCLLYACNCGVESDADSGSPLDAGGSTPGADAGGLSDAGSTDAGSTDAGSTDAGSADAGSADAGSDAGVVDAGMSDAGSGDAGAGDAGQGDGGFTPGRFFSFRLAYRPQMDAAFTPPPFADLCVRPINDTTWTRVYGPPGIGIGEVGRQHRVNGGNWAFKIIDVTQSCDQAGIFESSQVLGNDSVHKRVTVNFVRGRIMGVVAREQFARFDDAMLGRQDWLTAYPDSAASTLFFAVDGGMPVRVDSIPLRLDAGVTGVMTLGSMSVGYRAGSGTSTSVFLNAFMPTVAPLFCDDFAPSAGVLSVCSTNLRPP